MIKSKYSPYIPGRPKGHWYKWKKDPKTVDAILMYAVRGHGKRSSYYSDFTFGLWDGNQLSPIGKAYFGFNDNELKTWAFNYAKALRKLNASEISVISRGKRDLSYEIANQKRGNSISSSTWKCSRSAP